MATLWFCLFVVSFLANFFLFKVCKQLKQCLDDYGFNFEEKINEKNKP